MWKLHLWPFSLGFFWFVFGLSCMTMCWLDLQAFKTYMIFNRIMQIVNILFPQKSVAPRLFQLFRRMLSRCFSFAVKLQNILRMMKTSPDFPSARSWVDNDWIFIEGRVVLFCFSPTLIQTDLTAVRFDWLYLERLDLTWNQTKKTFKSGLIKILEHDSKGEDLYPATYSSLNISLLGSLTWQDSVKNWAKNTFNKDLKAKCFKERHILIAWELKDEELTTNLLIKTFNFILELNQKNTFKRI